MRRRTRSIAALTVLLVPIVAATGLVWVAEAALATTCCAATDYSCAGLRAPDECCQHMGHSGGFARVATVERVAGAVPVPSAAAAVPQPPLLSVGRGPIISATAARLHDPPHLHTFALLI